MRSKASYNYIYQVQRMIMIFFFLATTVALSVPLMALLVKVANGHHFPIVAGMVLYILLVVFIAGLIHVISFIPFNLASAFDPIKNDIATGKTKKMSVLAEQITAFTVSFYNFSFLDISHAWMQTDGEVLMGHEDGKVVEKVLEEYGVLERSKEMEDITLAGKLEIGGKDHSLYIMPLRIGDRWLGYMALLSRKPISRFFRRFLEEYEDNFLDDQILHLVRKNSGE